LVNTGLTGSPLITGVTQVTPSTYNVTASTGNGTGSLGLNLVDDDTIIDAATNKLGGTGTGNSNFTGQVYNIDRTLTPHITADNKTYDGDTTATLSDCSFTSALTVTESVNVSCTSPTFAGAGVGSHNVSANISLTGSDASKYVLSSTTASTTANITSKAVTATLAAADKIYDGNATEPDANMNCVLSGVAGIDTLNAVCTATAGSFNSPNVATANHVAATVTIGGTAAGNYTLGAAGTSINSTSATATAHILKATPTLSTTGGTFTYDGNPHSSVGTALGIDGVQVGGTFVYTYTPPGDSTAPVNASATPYSVSAAFTATDPNYNNGTPAVNSITINRASSTTVISCPASVTFNALAQTPCTATATGAGSLSVGVNVTYGNNTNAGTATADATYSGDSNHNGSTATQVTFTIAKAVADCSSIAGYSGTYDGAAHNATGNCTGVAGDASAAGSSLDLGQPFTNFPGGTATWVFTGGTNYTDQTGAVSITIGRANATINVVGFTGEYDRVAHNATGTATGVLAENLNGLLSYSAPFTDVPGGTATWTFNAGNANNNYNSASGTVSIEITPKNLTIDGAVAQNKIYDGNATASVTFPTTPAGVIAPDDVTVESSGYSATFASADVADNIDVTVTGVTLAGAQAGNYTVSQPTGLKANITKLNLTISGAVAQPKIYDGNTDAVVDFTGYELHTPVSGDVVSLDTSGYTAHFGTKDAGTAIAVTVTGVMLAGADAGNYTVSQPAGLTADINRRTLTASIVGNPTRTYTGDDIAILAPSNFLIANLVSGEGFTVTETAGLYNSPDVTAANTVTAALDATDFTPVSGTLAANYDLPTSASGSGHITPATPLVHVTGGPFTYDANQHPATVMVTGVLNEAVSGTPTVTYSPPGDTTVPVNAGTYNVGVSFTSANSNYTNASGSGSIVINKAISITTVTFEVGPYTYRGSPFTATASATGVGGLNQMLSPTYSGDCTNVTVPDGCTASATFDGDDNHFGSNSSGSITITKAASTTTVTCPTNETYTSFAIEPCTAKVTGAGGLNIDPFTVSYTDNINAGTAHAGASYSGDQNHDPSSDAKTFTIDKAPTTTTVTCGTGPFVYNGSAFEPCTAMVTGPVLSQSLIVIYANNTDAGTASASASYSGDANLIASNDSKNFTIDKAPSTVTVTCPTSEVYSGSAQTPCTVSVTGVNLNLTPNPDYSDNVVVGTATASYTFGGDANHTGSSGSKQFQITKAPVTATAGSGSATYDNLTHTPSGCSVTGTYTGDLTCSNVPNTVGPDAGATTITPSVTGSGTENFDITPVNGSYTINQASSTTTVTCPPSQVYTGSPLTPCSASVTGAGGLSLALTPSYGNNTNPGTATANASYAGDANHTGSSNSANFSITNSAVANVTVSSAVINENGTATLTISFTDADAAQTHTGTINWGDGSSTQSLSVIPANIYSTTVSRTFLDDDPTATSSDLKNVSVTVTDGASTATGGSTVTINNVAPTVTSITGAPTAPVQINTPVSLTVNFADTGTKDTHTCSFNWDDMTPSAFVAGTVTETVGSGVGTCTGSKTFTVPGVYTILTSVQDDDTGSVTKGLDTQYVVVFDPNGGFVTGGGWIMSPAGASTQFPTATGKANFGFVSKYKKGSNIPDGQTEFQFQAGNLNFHSSSYDVGSLVISSYKAQYKGVGDINGVSGYKFILTAYDGDINGAGNDGIDKFRIKILDANNNVVYDNRMNASDDIDSIPMAISGGSISIQKAGK